MSRSNPTAKNPATRFLRWKGGEEGGGRLTWYNKETETEEDVKLPFSFLVLDELNTITGYSEKDQSGFWSNEVRSIMKDELVVKTGSGVVTRGKYGEIADFIKGKGAKYAKSVYIAFKNEEGELVIGNLQVAGSALTAWIEFQKKFNVMECAVLLSGAKAAKKGATKYFTPVFEGQAISAETDAAATELDKVLQAFLGAYLSRKPDETETTVADEPEDEDEDEAPAEPTTAPEVAAPAKPQPPKEVEPADDNKINLADVPF